MAVKKGGKGLGKGLDALIPKNIEISEESKKDNTGSEVIMSITKVEPNREQPRKNFDEEKLKELSDSIKQHGIVQPLTVQDMGDYYEIITGERRWRAARLAGLTEVPVIIRNYTDQEKAAISLIENIQREDLNPIEEAMAYKKLMTDYNLKQEELAEQVSKNRTTIANTMRLLNLCDEVQQMLVNNEISSGHARAILTIDDKDKQLEIAKKVYNEKLSVRDVEKLVKNIDKPIKKKEASPEILALLYKEYADNLRSKIGSKVNIQAKDENKGKIEIEFSSKEEFETIVNIIMS